MGYSNSVRQSVPAPKQSILGGALRGFGNSIQQGVARKDAKKSAEEKYLANYLTAMAQQGRTMTSGQPSWLQGKEFGDAPIDAAALKQLQETQDLIDVPAREREWNENLRAAAKGLDSKKSLDFMVNNPYRPLTPDNPDASKFYKQAGGDISTANKLAENAGYKVDKKLTPEIIQYYKKKAKGNKKLARDLAAADGYI